MTIRRHTSRSTISINNRVNSANLNAIYSSNKTNSFELLLVAGGGGGGNNVGGGGGGAGGLLYYGTETPKIKNGNAIVVPNFSTYTIVIGAGGISSPNNPGTVFTAGGNTSISLNSTLLYNASGGGQGAHRDYGGAGKAGGSGGGGAGYGQGTQPSAARPGGSGTSGQGTDGGTGSPDLFGSSSGGGGGGAGTGGSNAGQSGNALGGDGGLGVRYLISGSNVFYAGGGGGVGGTNTGGVGGLGGGGNGNGPNPSANGTPGSVNTGGGAGGGSTYTGGSGVAILRYPEIYDLASVSANTTYTNANGYHIYKFTGSGTITFSI
jgi:hypothetical protein